MIFNSFEFLLFLVAAFLIYWKLGQKGQNIFLVIASYVFYGWWDWRFLFLIFASTAVNFLAGHFISEAEGAIRRRISLVLNIVINLGILGFFKYYDFFVTTLQQALTSIGIASSSLTTLGIILPVGISFYTFQAMSYAIDVYRKNIPATKNFIDFMGFVSFFPQLVAGPIERASNLLSQFREKRVFSYPKAIDGCQQMLWGFFKKIVVADNLSGVVNNIYESAASASGWQLTLATFFFAFQVYCDFSGYSDIAIGTARLFGFSLMRNFYFPYFSKNIVQFWQRWHISLSTWFRDYLFIPLSRMSRNPLSLGSYARNILITFTVSGLWHGANWTFVFWGFLHGLYFIPYAALRNKLRLRRAEDAQPGLKDLHQILFNFLLVMFGWVFFRSENIAQAFYIIKKIFVDLQNIPSFGELYPKRLLLVGVFILAEWLQRNKAHPLQLENVAGWAKWLIYYIIIVLILAVGDFHYNPFIYFQF